MFTKVVFPECPPKPVKPKSPHPKWIVLALKKPECVRNDSGDLVWVFFSFYHITTYETRWFPPPRSQEETLIKPEHEQSEEEDDTDPEVIDVDADPNTKTQKDMGTYVVGHPKLASYAKELAGESESEEEEEDKGWWWSLQN